ncbi:SUMF1/EgtB/PvdO family nonheme iron enzyme [Candidatus Poribacteria bacterium]|nr:SUMF1/EgtB/PvdO family nonheme iron enzyme [Candidatus Poribacteria bacterium]
MVLHVLRTSCIFLAASIIASAGGSEIKEMAVELSGGASMDMIWIEPGSFIMGSPEDEPGREQNESPQHKVTITKGFWLGKYELTQAQWESVMGFRTWDNQVFVKRDENCPAVYLSWYHTQDFIEKLNSQADKHIYRLPTEAEWEYACRAGTQTAFSFGDDIDQLGDYAWYGRNTYNINERYAHQVGQKIPNPWGLYDMHGNVWEWVQDYYGEYTGEDQVDPKGPETGERRVFRGASFYYLGRFTRSAYRGYNSPRHRLFNLGMRLVMQED